MGIHLDRLHNNIGASKHAPFIVYDVETTGRMNGHDNRITEVALAAYAWNPSANQYELQDNIFILAKPDIEQLKRLESLAKPTEENVRAELESEYAYNFGRKERQAYERCLTNIQTYEKHVADHLAGKYKGRFSFAVLSSRLSEYKDKLPGLKKAADDAAEYKAMVGDDIKETEECKAYVKEHFDAKFNEMMNAPSLADELKVQGIDLKEYIKGELGCTSSEMQTGIAEFLKKRDSGETFFITNGTYFQKHYLSKAGMSIEKDPDMIVDYSLILREPDSGSVDVRLGSFIKDYKTRTGKEIRTFDAFTKALCYAEIAAATCSVKLSNRSLEQLTNAVKEDAFKNDNNYVMSISAMANVNWAPLRGSMEGLKIDYKFDSLEYVEFGNDRRYVDLDKMFEVNDNFEITLEGDKEPIKSWEELEAKIKALNSDISPELLEKIKTKFEEIEHKVEAEKPAVTVSDDVDVGGDDKEVREPSPGSDAVTVAPEIPLTEKVLTLDEKVRALEEKVKSVSLARAKTADELADVVRAQIEEVNRYLAPELNAAENILRTYFKEGTPEYIVLASEIRDIKIGSVKFGGGWTSASISILRNDIRRSGLSGYDMLFDKDYLKELKTSLAEKVCSALEECLKKETLALGSLPKDLKVVPLGDDTAEDVADKEPNISDDGVDDSGFSL